MASTPEACLQLYFTALHDCDGDAFDALLEKPPHVGAQRALAVRV